MNILLTLWNFVFIIIYAIQLSYGHTEKDIYKICFFGFLLIGIILLEIMNQLNS